MKYKTKREGKLSIQPYFTKSYSIPEQSVEWGKRDVRIKDADGKIVYERRDLEFPTNWSDLASKVVANKYFYEGDGKKPIESSLKSLVKRVNETMAKEAVRQGIFSKEEAKIFRNELSYMHFNQLHSFNSPVWFNLGLSEAYGVRETSKSYSHWAVTKKGNFTNKIDTYKRPQVSACFIQSIKDDMRSIFEHAKKEAMLFKYGSGTGTNYGPIRGVGEPLSGGGKASGQQSFNEIFDKIAGSVQSGGKTRRAAKMVIEPCDHPDLYRFIYWKVNEEKKALWLSINPKWAPKNAGDLESEAYRTVSGQNGNNSIRVTDEFMNAALAGDDWNLWFRTANRFKEEIEIPLEKYEDDRYLPDKRFIKRLTNKRKVINAAEALEHIARAAAVTGDPALQYDTTINKWNTCPNSGRINASNPCSEYMFLDDSACNLASLRLTKFSERAKDGEIINLEAFKTAVRNSIIAQEILVDYASYPSKEIAKNSHLFRALGLGYADLGALLMERGIAYDSEEGRAIASAVTSLMTGYAYLTSSELAEKLGPFKEFEKNKEPMLQVMRMHQEATKKIKRINKVNGLEKLIDEAEKVWDEVIFRGEKYGFRNAQVTLLAPTGTIGFMMDVDCTGIEPMIGLISTKSLSGGGELKRPLASCVIKGLKSLGYEGGRLEKIIEYITENGSVINAPGLKKEHYKVFATAFGDNAISVDGHLKMMAAVQPFLSGAISKTVNLPKGSTIQDVRDVYIKGWKLGLKSISLYIDGAKGIQPVNIKSKQESKELKWGDRIKPENPVLKGGHINRAGWNVTINGVGVHFIVGEYEDRPPKDAPADFFVLFGSSGSPLAASYSSWGKEASRGRQKGGTIEEFIKHNKGASGTIHGMTDHPFIRTCSSIEDMFAKIIQLEYLGDLSVCDVKPSEKQMKELRCNVLARLRRLRHYQSRIDFIETAMEEGKLTEVFPLYEDELKKGEIPIFDIYCKKCGHKTVPSGANCRKCINCGDSGGCG